MYFLGTSKSIRNIQFIQKVQVDQINKFVFVTLINSS